MEIRLINGKWCVNGKSFNELTPNEIIILDKFIKDYEHSKGKPKSKSR